MPLTETIRTCFKVEAEPPMSDVESAALRFQCSTDMADIIASLGDHTDEQIGAMVRMGFEKAMSRQREYRRMLNCMTGIHGDADAEMDTDGQ